MSRILATCCLLILFIVVNQSIAGKVPVVETFNHLRIFDFKVFSRGYTNKQTRFFSFQKMTDAAFDMDTALAWYPVA